MSFQNLEVIDMDTIDLSNLNRQFLFRCSHFVVFYTGETGLYVFNRQTDIGQPKAVVAANFINKRIYGCNVTPHYSEIQDKDESFYRSQLARYTQYCDSFDTPSLGATPPGFHLIVCGLDSIQARRWLNGMIVGLLEYNEDGQVNPASIVPMVDGGSEGRREYYM